MTCSWLQLACGERTTDANAKPHIVNHLVRDALVWEAGFQDVHVANSDTNGPTCVKDECDEAKHGITLTSEIQVGAEDAEEHQRGGADFTPVPTGARGGDVFLCLGGKGEVLQGGVVWLRSHIADDDHDDCGYESNQQAPVLEIDVVDDPEERAVGIAVLQAAEAKGYGRVHEHAEDAKNETYDHGPKCALGIHALENDAQEEHHEDGRREITLNGLQVAVEPLGILDDRNPCESDEYHYGGGKASRADEVMLRGAGLPLLVEVNGKER